MFSKKKKVSKAVDPLPKNYPKKMMELEIKLARNKLSLPLLNQLLNLYSRAVEHFDASNDNENYEYYKEKIRITLANPEVKKIINLRKGDTKDESPKETKENNQNANFRGMK
jgi:hypothetical protein